MREKKFKLVRHKEIVLFSFLHIVYLFLSNNKSFIIGFFPSELTNSLPMVTYQWQHLLDVRTVVLNQKHKCEWDVHLKKAFS